MAFPVACSHATLILLSNVSFWQVVVDPLVHDEPFQIAKSQPTAPAAPVFIELIAILLLPGVSSEAALIQLTLAAYEFVPIVDSVVHAPLTKRRYVISLALYHHIIIGSPDEVSQARLIRSSVWPDAGVPALSTISLFDSILNVVPSQINPPTLLLASVLI